MAGTNPSVPSAERRDYCRPVAPPTGERHDNGAIMTHCDHCDRDRLKRLLDESLPEAVESEVSTHVASCPACQVELESLAAGRGWWDEAGRRLSGLGENAAFIGLMPHASHGTRDELSGESEGGRTGRPSYGDAIHEDSSHADEAARFATDFAVDCLEPSDDSAMLGRLGEYEIVEVIGRGGMGVVLKGFQKELHRYVAVKVLAPHLATSGAARRRFAREAQATAAIVNPHVMAIHSVNANAKLPYLVMPFVACESLQQRLDQHGPLDVKDVLRIGMQAALGLAAAHAQGLVHRDVKPANILLETNVDRVMLTDFGLARAVDDATLTRTGIIAGTPQYMSPEQANGDAVDHRSDLFSLGSVLYAMCTGRPPFRAETTFGVLRRIRETAPRPISEINADIPEWLDHVVMKLLSKEAASRIATATEVASLLEQCLAHVQQPTTVALPDAIVGWALLPVLGGAANTKRSGKSAQPTNRRVALMAVVATTALATLLVAIVAWPHTKSVTKHDGALSPTASVTSPHNEPLTNAASLTNNPLLEWNATQTELDETARSIEQLDADAREDLEGREPNDKRTTEPTRAAETELAPPTESRSDASQ